MNTKQQWVWAAAAFVGGLATGLLLAPESGRDVRHRISRTAQGSISWMEHRLRDVEAQLHDLEKQLQAITRRMPDEGAEWTLQGTDLIRDLRRMPRQ